MDTHIPHQSQWVAQAEWTDTHIPHRSVGGTGRVDGYPYTPSVSGWHRQSGQIPIYPIRVSGWHRQSRWIPVYPIRASGWHGQSGQIPIYPISQWVAQAEWMDTRIPHQSVGGMGRVDRYPYTPSVSGWHRQSRWIPVYPIRVSGWHGQSGQIPIYPISQWVARAEWTDTHIPHQLGSQAHSAIPNKFNFTKDYERSIPLHNSVHINRQLFNLCS